MKFYQKAIISGAFLLGSLGLVGCEVKDSNQEHRTVYALISGRVINERLDSYHYYFSLSTEYGRKVFDCPDYRIGDGTGAINVEELEVLINPGDSVRVLIPINIPTNTNQDLDSKIAEGTLIEKNNFRVLHNNIKVY